MYRFVCVLLFSLLGGTYYAHAQSIAVNSNSVDSIFRWFNNGFPANEIQSLVKIPGNQIMEQLFLNKEEGAITFSDALLYFSREQYLLDNSYLLNDAYNKQEEIDRLAKALIDSTSNDKIIEYVKGYFPSDFKSSNVYNIYFTCTGWQWGDAMAFNYIKEGDNFIISKKGNPAIIFNLTIVCSTYGKTLEKQITSYKKVLAHELFHIFLNDYIVGKNYYIPEQIESKLLFMLMNEGIAHYIADSDNISLNYNTLKEKEKSCFSLFNEKAEIIFDDSKDMESRNKALNEGLYGAYWSKYICVTGLFISHYIYQYGGHDLLKECIEKGPNYFIEKYREISKMNDELPPLFEGINKNDRN